MNTLSVSQADQSANDFDLVALWRVAWAYKLLIILTVALFTGGAVVLALTATPIYRAEIIIAEAGDGAMGAGGILGKQLGGLAGLAGIDLGSTGGNVNAVPILKSRRMVEEFIRRNDLIPTLYPHAKKPPTLWHAVKRFRQDVLSFREEKRNNTTAVAINWTDPKIAARWANQFVSLTNELIRMRAIEESKKNVAYLHEQIKQTSVVELQGVMYDLIETETKTLMLASGREEYAFTVIDPAVAPELRFRPQRTSMVLFGAAAGLLLGLLAVFAVHSVRSRKARSA